MFIELVDVLRCPHRHEESWLVLGAQRMDGRDVVEGVLGCPVCRARYRITKGVADLRTQAAAPAVGSAAATSDDDAQQAVRLAAFLNLADERGYAVLMGAWTRYAADVHALAGTRLLLANPHPGAAVGAGASGLLVDTRLPLAAASARALALDTEATPAFAAEAVQVLQSGGRVVAPTQLPVPAGVTELVRDATVWVGERDADASGLVPLARAGR